MGTVTLLADIPARPSLRLQRFLPDPPAAVWRALTDPERFRTCLFCDLVLDDGGWTVGARLSFRFVPELIELTHPGEVIEVEEPRVLSYSFGEELLRYALEPGDGGTLLVLSVELPARSAAIAAATWDIYLDRLAGMTFPASDWAPRYRRHADRFVPILGAQEGPPVHLEM